MKSVGILTICLLLTFQAHAQSRENITSVGVLAGSLTGVQLHIAGVCTKGQRNRPYAGVELEVGKWMQSYSWYKSNPAVPYQGFGGSVIAFIGKPLSQAPWKKSWLPTYHNGYGIGLLRLIPSNPEDYWTASAYTNFYFCANFGLSLEAPKRVVAFYVDARPFLGLKNAPHRLNGGCLVQVGMRARLSKPRKLRPW